MSIHPLDALVILVYLGLMLAIGLAFSRRAGSSTQEFFLSGRSLPWFVAGTSMAATTFASDTPLVVTELVRRQGIGGNWIWVNFAISHVVTTFLLARLWRRSGVTTDVELCELRYSGRGAACLRAFKGLFYALVTNVVVLGWVILGMTAIAGIFGVPKLVTLAACIVLASLYASLAGLWGVVLTDLLQLAVALTGAVILAVKVLAAEGGLSGLRERLPALADAAGEPAARLAPLAGFDWASPGFRGAFMGFAVAVLVQWWSWKYSDGGGVLIQRMNSSRTERDSLLATLWFAVVTYVIRPWPWYLVGPGQPVGPAGHGRPQGRLPGDDGPLPGAGVAGPGAGLDAGGLHVHHRHPHEPGQQLLRPRRVPALHQARRGRASLRGHCALVGHRHRRPG